MEQSPKIVGFTCGAFDLVHAGHILMFKEAKEHCDWLVVGLQIDPSVDRPGKHKPIMSLKERATILSAISYIDEVRVYSTERDLVQLLKEVRPDVRIIGADWRDKRYTGWDLPIKTIFNSRNHTYSTSSLRERIYEAEKALRR